MSPWCRRTTTLSKPSSGRFGASSPSGATGMSQTTSPNCFSTRRPVVVVKAQVKTGGRGKAGGVKFCKTTDDVKAAAAKMLGTKMATYQTAGVELPVNLVLVTTAGEIVKELYLSVLVDRGTKTITYIASSEGGVEIEQVAADHRQIDIGIQTIGRAHIQIKIFVAAAILRGTDEMKIGIE